MSVRFWHTSPSVSALDQPCQKVVVLTAQSLQKSDVHFNPLFHIVDLVDLKCYILRKAKRVYPHRGSIRELVSRRQATQEQDCRKGQRLGLSQDMLTLAQ